MTEEKKRTMTFKWIEKDLEDLYKFIGFSEQSGEFFIHSMENKLRKLIFDNSSPAPLSPSGEQSPTVETETAPETDNPLTVAQENPCRYRTVLNVKGNAIDTQVICAETDKLPLAACNTRHKRYADNGDQCQPLLYERLLLKTVKLQRRQPTTQPFKGNDFLQERRALLQEGVLPRFYCPDGHNPSWCHGDHSCGKRLQCAESRQHQPSR